MKRTILLSLAGVGILAVYALAQQVGNSPQPQVTSNQKQGPASCPQCMPKRGAQMQKKAMNPAMMQRCSSMMQKTGKDPAIMKSCMEMMQKTGMKPAMMKHMQIMMQTPIFVDSPCAIYGQATNLGLSAEQKAEIMNITNEARRKALAVLTPAQRKKLGDIPNKPMVMMQMPQQMCNMQKCNMKKCNMQKCNMQKCNMQKCKKMMPMMQKMMGSKDGQMKNCPMMKMMGGPSKK